MKIVSRKVTDLSNDPANARKHSERNIESIVASLRRFGQQKPIVVDSSGVVRAGNGTLEAARRLGWEKVDCVISDLKGSEATAYAIADNRTAELAEWDDAVLAAELNGLLADDADLLDAAGFTTDELEKMLAEIDGETSDGETPVYTAKVTAPIYEPKGEKPRVSELLDRAKADALIEDVKKSNASEQVKQFLIFAAERHVVFNFRNIAEFYCHESAEVQELMERSGLVIIDFDKAIQYGFVHVTERLAKIADLELASEGEFDDAA